MGTGSVHHDVFCDPWVVIIGQTTMEKNLGIDVMAQLKASVLKAQRHQDVARMELTARYEGEASDGAVLRAPMAVTTFVPGGDAPGDVVDEVALTLPCQRSMILQDPEVEMRDRAGVLETQVDYAVDHGFRRNVPRRCAISFCSRTLTCFVGRCPVTTFTEEAWGDSV